MLFHSPVAANWKGPLPKNSSRVFRRQTVDECSFKKLAVLISGTG